MPSLKVLTDHSVVNGGGFSALGTRRAIITPSPGCLVYFGSGVSGSS
jgi:hypothetical protein